MALIEARPSVGWPPGPRNPWPGKKSVSQTAHPPPRGRCLAQIRTRPYTPGMFAHGIGRASVAGSLLALLACSGQPKEEPRGAQPPTDVRPAPAEQASAAPTDPERADAADAAEPSGPAPAVETFGPAKLTALDDEARAKLWAGESDDPIPVDTHYVQSNETRHDLFFPYVEGIGGAFIGVGSDQSFTMMARARSELAFLIDIDYRVVDLQRMYAVMLPRAETPEALVAMWDKPNEDTSIAMLEEAFAEEEDGHRARIIRGYRAGRETVHRHLLRVIGRKVGGEPASWLSNPEMYAHVRALYQTGRVRMMPGNLAGETSLRTIAQVCKSLDVPVRVLYMSNAEEYFKYTKTFRENIEAMPMDDKSMVLRTIYSKNWEHADLWAYQVQPLLDFRERLGDSLNRSRNPMLRYAEREGALDKSTGKKGLTRVAIGEPT
jgi:hypothetical protein